MEMGLFFAKSTFKRKFRWSFEIDPYVGMTLKSNMLPPSKAARPSISFKEQSIEHLFETVSVPMKPEWSTMEVSLYDIACDENPIFTWLRTIYNPKQGDFGYLIGTAGNTFKIPTAFISCLDGCGDPLECWAYEGVWAQKIDWGELDMGATEVTMVDLTLRYDRAYQIFPCPDNAVDEER